MATSAPLTHSFSIPIPLLPDPLAALTLQQRPHAITGDDSHALSATEYENDPLADTDHPSTANPNPLSISALSALSSTPSTSLSPAASVSLSYVHVQIWFLSNSLFVWIGHEQDAESGRECVLNQMNCAFKAHGIDSIPSQTTLLSPTEADMAQAVHENTDDNYEGQLASRIASIFSCPIFLSVNINQRFNAPSAPGVAETAYALALDDLRFRREEVQRVLISELKACKKLGFF